MAKAKKFDPRTMPDVAPPEPIETYEQADRALLQIGQYESEIQKEEAALNEKIQELREAYETKTYVTRTMKAGLETNLQSFCVDNKKDFEKPRVNDLMHGSMGFRNSPPKVGLLNRKYNWETALELLKKMKWGKDLIRIKDEINKEAILEAIAAKTMNDVKLASVGIKVDQGEEWTYSIKWEEIPDAVTAAQ